MALLDSEKTVFDDFASEFPLLTTTEIRNSLAAFMFCGEDVFKTINMLSGGEKVRLQLAKILKKGPNFLVLDEPTNHMDIVGKETLENMLSEYKGTLMKVVSSNVIWGRKGFPADYTFLEMCMEITDGHELIVSAFEAGNGQGFPRCITKNY